MRDVAVVSFAQSPSRRQVLERNEVEILMPVVREAVERSGIEKKEIGFICSGSSDYVAGVPFSFVMSLDAVGAWPPVCESHLEMDAAWALYEAWVKIQVGEQDSALIYGSGKSSMCNISEVLSRQLDPYYMGPLWPDAMSLAALQARLLLETGRFSERDLAEVVVRSRRNAKQNPCAQLAGDLDLDELLAEPMIASPLRKHDCAPISDGAAAVMLAAGDLARSVCERPAWIAGIDHRIEAHDLGVRDLTQSVSTALAAEKAGLWRAPVEIAELCAPFSHQELILREAMRLGEEVKVNPSGGALCANPVMAAGLIRIGEAAERIRSGAAGRAVAHATSGPCLQQNLVCVLEAR